MARAAVKKVQPVISSEHSPERRSLVYTVEVPDEVAMTWDHKDVKKFEQGLRALMSGKATRHPIAPPHAGKPEQHSYYILPSFQAEDTYDLIRQTVKFRFGSPYEVKTENVEQGLPMGEAVAKMFGLLYPDAPLLQTKQSGEIGKDIDHLEKAMESLYERLQKAQMPNVMIGAGPGIPISLPYVSTALPYVSTLPTVTTSGTTTNTPVWNTPSQLYVNGEDNAQFPPAP